MRVLSATRLFIDEQELDVAADPGQSWLEVLCAALDDAAVWIGETVVVGLDRPASRAGIGAALIGDDVVMRRSDSIWDLYSSALGSALLEACRTHRRPHHTQVRWYSLGGHQVAQVAVYPEPLVVAGTRIWCDPALVVVLVESGGTGEVLEVMRVLQPLWERLRGHHGAPLTSRPHPRLDAVYPVPNRPRHLDAAGLQRLSEAIDYISSDAAVDDVAHAQTSPQDAVVQMMLARKLIEQHEVRLSVVLEHSHGTMDAKFDALRHRAEGLLGDGAVAALHVSQPHFHLLAAQRETIEDVRALTERTSETAHLLASAAVGRLLDRSEANRTAGTAVGSGLAIIALVSIFAALAAVPTNRSFRDYVSLSGWIGFAGVVVTALVVGLTQLAYRSAESLSARQRRVCAVAGVAAACVAPVLFAWGAVAGSVVLVATGAAATVVAVASYAYVNEFR